MISILSWSNGTFTFDGLSSDTKPSAPNGSSFLEANTGKTFFMESGAWVEKLNPAYTPAGFVGYATGAGGTVTQLTSKATGVTLNKACGAITTHNAALAAAAEVSFTVTNNTVAATDCIVVNHASGGTGGAYVVEANTIAAGSFRITLGNMSAGSLGEALVLRFAVIKAVAA